MLLTVTGNGPRFEGKIHLDCYRGNPPPCAHTLPVNDHEQKLFIGWVFFLLQASVFLDGRIPFADSLGELRPPLTSCRESGGLIGPERQVQGTANQHTRDTLQNA